MRRASLLIVFFAVASGCRPRIEAVTVPPRAVPPKPTADVKVCWIESDRIGPATASAIVVRHPDGDVLIDAGASLTFDEEIRVYDGPDRRWFKRLPGLLVPKRSIATLLRTAGVDPEALRWFLPTHVHIDHVAATSTSAGLRCCSTPRRSRSSSAAATT